jgi:hypothetical protein
MGFNKIVAKAILSTLAAIAILCATLSLLLVYLYPSTVMQLSYDLGMDKASIQHANTAYERSGEKEIYYIAFATEVSIGLNDSESIEACAEKLIGNSEFKAYCEAKDKTSNVAGEYAQYYYGQLYLAKYKNGKAQDAIDGAFATLNGGFPANNAVGVVLIAAINASDENSIQQISEKLAAASIDETALTDTEKTYLEQVRSILAK